MYVQKYCTSPTSVALPIPVVRTLKIYPVNKFQVYNVVNYNYHTIN